MTNDTTTSRAGDTIVSPAKQRVLASINANMPRRTGATGEKQQYPSYPPHGASSPLPPSRVFPPPTPSSTPRTTTKRASPVGEGLGTSPSKRQRVELDASGTGSPLRYARGAPDHGEEGGRRASQDTVSPAGSVVSTSASAGSTKEADLDDVTRTAVAVLRRTREQGLQRKRISLSSEGLSPTRRARNSAVREDTRRRAETLRLRLGLASYKVRTGQTNVPLDKLIFMKATASANTTITTTTAATTTAVSSAVRGRARAHTVGGVMAHQHKTLPSTPSTTGAKGGEGNTAQSSPIRRPSLGQGSSGGEEAAEGAANGLLSLAVARG